MRQKSLRILQQPDALGRGAARQGQPPAHLLEVEVESGARQVRDAASQLLDEEVRATLLTQFLLGQRLDAVGDVVREVVAPLFARRARVIERLLVLAVEVLA